MVPQDLKGSLTFLPIKSFNFQLTSFIETLKSASALFVSTTHFLPAVPP